MRGTAICVKVLLVLISILYTLVFLGVGFLLIWSDNDGSLDWYIDSFLHSAWSKVAGVGLMLIAIGSVLLRVIRFRKIEYLTFENPDGDVIIAIKAIEDFIKRLANSFGEIKEIVPAIAPKDDGIDVELKLVLWDDENVHATVEKMKNVMRDQIQNFFGVANINSMKIYVTRTVPRDRHTEKTTSIPEQIE